MRTALPSRVPVLGKRERAAREHWIFSVQPAVWTGRWERLSDFTLITLAEGYGGADKREMRPGTLEQDVRLPCVVLGEPRGLGKRWRRSVTHYAGPHS